MKKTSQNIEYQFRDIIQLEFFVNEHNLDVSKIVDKLKMSFTSGISADPMSDRMFFDLRISTYFDLEPKLECFSIVQRNVFDVKNFPSLIGKSGELDLPPDFLSLIASLSYSSSRGILKEKLSGTRYNEFFLLPVIDPKQLIQNISQPLKRV